jgi:hypothetical protein
MVFRVDLITEPDFSVRRFRERSSSPQITPAVFNTADRSHEEPSFAVHPPSVTHQPAGGLRNTDQTVDALRAQPAFASVAIRLRFY